MGGKIRGQWGRSRVCGDGVLPYSLLSSLEGSSWQVERWDWLSWLCPVPPWGVILCLQTTRLTHRQKAGALERRLMVSTQPNSPATVQALHFARGDLFITICSGNLLLKVKVSHKLTLKPERKSYRGRILHAFLSSSSPHFPATLRVRFWEVSGLFTLLFCIPETSVTSLLLLSFPAGEIIATLLGSFKCFQSVNNFLEVVKC